MVMLSIDALVIVVGIGVTVLQLVSSETLAKMRLMNVIRRHVSITQHVLT